MAGDVNVVVVSGKITRDPDIRSTPSGKTVARFTIESKMIGFNGKDYGTYIDAVRWCGSGSEDILTAKSGDRVIVNGTITTESWDDKQTGQKRYKTIIKADNVSVVGEFSQGQQPDYSNQPRYDNSYRPAPQDTRQERSKWTPSAAQNSSNHSNDPMAQEEEQIPF